MDRIQNVNHRSHFRGVNCHQTKKGERKMFWAQKQKDSKFQGKKKST